MNVESFFRPSLGATKTQKICGINLVFCMYGCVVCVRDAYLYVCVCMCVL